MNSSLYGQIAKYGMVLALGAILARSLGFAHRWWAMYVLDIEQYANFALIIGLYFALVPVAGFGLTPSIARYLAGTNENLCNMSHVFVSGALIGFFSSIICVITFLVFLPNVEMQHSIVILGFLLCWGCSVTL